MRLTRQQVFQLAGEASVDPRTVEKIYDGSPSRKMIRDRVVAAAKELKMTPPPAPKVSKEKAV